MSGGIRAVAGSPFATDSAGEPLAMSRDAKFLYSINSTDGSLVAFTLHSDGTLADVPGSPFATTHPVANLAAHPTADFLYAFDFNGDLEVYAINPSTGALTAQPGDSMAAVGGSAVVIAPDGKHLYAFPLATMYEYSIDMATGALTAAGSPIQIGFGGPESGSATIDPSGRFIYVTDPAETTGFGFGMSAVSIDPQTGAVIQITGYSPTAGPQGSVVVDASGKYAVIATGVTSKTGPNCFAVASIDETNGMLSSVAGSPFPGPFTNDCGALLADPSGSYIYSGSGGVAVYSLDETTGVPQFVTDSALAGMVIWSLAVTH